MDIEVLPPAPGEVRVKVLYTGVCHTDEYTRSGLDPEGVFPSILGHEGGGVVESIGEGVTEFAIGDHVIPLYIPQCRKCKYCKSTKTNLCQSVRPTQGRGLMPDQTARFKIVSTGESVFHFMGCSTFSQYTVLPEVSLVKINKEAPLDKVCLLGCGITTGYGAVINTLKVEAGASVLVIGLGGVGLAAIMGASKVGATRIIGVDLNAGKFERAMQFGATDVINPLDKEKYGSKMLPEIIFDLTEGVGVDYSIECVGTPFTMKQAFECTKPNGGCSCVIGVAASG
jgi:S-(hydroxymethyl)glutathione dehydrogenase/alcohol dehydrogenase